MKDLDIDKTTSIRKAEKNARASQMFAEMLVIACHPEYHNQGEQTVPLGS
jgi:hypothetical protein